MQLDKPKILITGATGFIGCRLCELASQNNLSIRQAVRQPNFQDNEIVVDLEENTDWSKALKGIEIIIHLAARVHVMRDKANDPLEEFRKINTIGTLNLARQAAKLGVKRFIYLSSIKVNGEMTHKDHPFKADDKFVPTDSYALSKYEAEQGLLSLAKESNIDVVIIRPPLVYGPKVKANFLSMMKWQFNSIPLPFGAIHNKRSLVALDNLVDLILICVEHPSAANEVFLVSDDEDLSTSELLVRVSNVEGKRPWLLPVNQKVLEFCLIFLGKKDLAKRLCGSLQVDISKTKKLLNWTPPLSVDAGLAKSVKYFIHKK